MSGVAPPVVLDLDRSVGALPMEEWTVYRVTGDALAKLADKN